MAKSTSKSQKQTSGDGASASSRPRAGARAKEPSTQGKTKTKPEVKTKPKVKTKTKVVPLEAMNDATYYHVMKRGNQWAVKRHGAERAAGLYDTKAEAVRAAREIKTLNKHIFVHKMDGSIDKWIRSRSA